MSRGEKLDIFIGATIEDGWAKIESPRKSSLDDTLLEPSKHFLLFKKEKRRGKTVTLVGPFALNKNDTEELLKRIKKKLGCGGSYKEFWMEFQGELKDKLRELLVQENFRFKNTH
ncbi:MAG: translation initiation factor [Sulfurimonas sp.]|nr:translation initiation factor [Sulfurimonas sp.]MDD5201945.1 translation initiation factor [Sulfurimonas sp.]